MLVLGFVYKALYIEGILYGAMFSDCELMKFLCSGIKVYGGSQTSPLSEKKPWKSGKKDQNLMVWDLGNEHILFSSPLHLTNPYLRRTPDCVRHLLFFFFMRKSQPRLEKFERRCHFLCLSNVTLSSLEEGKKPGINISTSLRCSSDQEVLSKTGLTPATGIWFSVTLDITNIDRPLNLRERIFSLPQLQRFRYVGLMTSSVFCFIPLGSSLCGSSGNTYINTHIHTKKNNFPL